MKPRSTLVVAVLATMMFMVILIIPSKADARWDDRLAASITGQNPTDIHEPCPPNQFCSLAAAASTSSGYTVALDCSSVAELAGSTGFNRPACWNVHGTASDGCTPATPEQVLECRDCLQDPTPAVATNAKTTTTPVLSRNLVYKKCLMPVVSAHVAATGNG